MQITTITLSNDGSYKTEEIQTRLLAEMSSGDIKFMLIETHTVIWSPLQHVAFVDLDMEKQLKSKGIKTFTKDGQEFNIVGLEKEEFTQLVKKICSLAKGMLSEQETEQPQKSSKKDLERKVTAELTAKTSHSETGKANRKGSSDRLILSRQTRQFVYRIALAILREIREQAKKKSEWEKETKEEYKRIDRLQIERKSREEATLNKEILTKETSKRSKH